jgi:hypothetical protein
VGKGKKRKKGEGGKAIFSLTNGQETGIMRRVFAMEGMMLKWRS